MIQRFSVPTVFLNERAGYEKGSHVNAIGYVPYLCDDSGRMSGDQFRRKVQRHLNRDLQCLIGWFTKVGGPKYFRDG